MAAPTSLAKKAGAVQFNLTTPDATASPTSSAASSAPAVESGTPAARPAKPYSGVGRVSSVIGGMHARQAEVEQLQGQVEQLEKERGAQLIDSDLIAESRWANRHPDSYSSPDFSALREEIQDAGGNVQPIKIRPRAGAKDGEPIYEIVFGHRRHRACLELRIPVLAVVQPLSDQELFAQMERENRNRQGLSAYEQGKMYRRALDEGLFPSARKLSESIGRSSGDVTKAMQIAKLPHEVIEAFPSPNNINFQWATDLAAAVEQHRATVLAAAAAAREKGLGAAQVFTLLTACLREPHQSQPAAKVKRALNLGAVKGAVIETDTQGRTLLRLPAGVLPTAKWAALEEALTKILEEA